MIRLKGYIIDNLMKWILYFLVILFALFTGLTVNGQDKEVDSLRKIHDLAKEDTVRIEVLIGIGDLVRNNMPDSSLACYEEALNQANKSLEIAGSKKNASLITNKLSLLKSISLKKIGNIQANMGSYEKACDYYSEALKIAERLANKNEIANINNNIGLVYLNHSNYDSAFVNFREFLKTKQETWDSLGIARAFCNIGIVYFEQGRYDLALENYIASIKIAETQNYIDLEADLCANVGIVNKRLGNFNKALEYYLRSLEIHKERDNKYGLAADYGDIANIYSILADNDSALENLQASIKLYEELGDKNGLAIAYNNIGDCYLKTGEYKRTEGYFQKSLAIYEATGNKAGVANSYNSIATLNSIMADSIVNIDEETRIKYFNNSINYGIKGYNLALEIGSVYLQNNSASNLYKVNSKLGRYREALKYAEIVISTQDSLFSESKTKALTEMSIRYEAEKKQLQIEKMEQQKELDNKTIEAQQAENKKQQIIIISVICGLVVVLIFSVIIFRMFRQKRRANILLAEQNERINQQNLLLSEQKKEITDSIRYAKRIQSALLPDADQCKRIFGEHFVLFRPKDIVSGDFYWGGKYRWLAYNYSG